MTFRRLFATAATAAMLSLPAVALAGDPPSDAFVAGYAAAVLERELGIKADGLSVVDGHVTVVRPPLSPAETDQLVKVLSAVPGVKDVTVQSDPPRTATAIAPMEPARVKSATTTPSSSASELETKIDTGDTPLTLYLGIGRAFAPLQADPRWPHFYASYNHYTRDLADTHLSNVASVGFGETIALIKQTYSSGLRWDAGVQGGLFAILDMDSDSKDLINADYFVGPYLGVRKGDFSLLARAYHQSSHLGDEYVLRPVSETRVNYSFETLNLLLSYDLPKGFRVYAGGAYKFDIDPDDVDPWSVQYGVEWTSPETVFGTSWLRPVAALDVQNAETSDWAFSFSLRAGVQVEDPSRYAQRLQFMFEFYDGNSPNGQFYDDHIRFYGFGAHFYF